MMNAVQHVQSLCWGDSSHVVCSGCPFTSCSQLESTQPVAGRDVAPGLESTTQVNSTEGPGRVSGELLDALERDLNVVVAPKRRVRRVFFDNVESVVQQSRGRFQAFSSDEELARGELPTQVDRESSVFDLTVADSPDEDEHRVVQPVDVPRGRRVVFDSPVGHSIVSAQHV